MQEQVVNCGIVEIYFATARMPMRRGGLPFVDPVSRFSEHNGNRHDFNK
jgi:hypothetical protein